MPPAANDLQEAYERRLQHKQIVCLVGQTRIDKSVLLKYRQDCERVKESEAIAMEANRCEKAEKGDLKKIVKKNKKKMTYSSTMSALNIQRDNETGLSSEIKEGFAGNSDVFVNYIEYYLRGWLLQGRNVNVVRWLRKRSKYLPAKFFEDIEMEILRGNDKKEKKEDVVEERIVKRKSVAKPVYRGKAFTVDRLFQFRPGETLEEFLIEQESVKGLEMKGELRKEKKRIKKESKRQTRCKDRKREQSSNKDIEIQKLENEARKSRMKDAVLKRMQYKPRIDVEEQMEYEKRLTRVESRVGCWWKPVEYIEFKDKWKGKKSVLKRSERYWRPASAYATTEAIRENIADDLRVQVQQDTLRHGMNVKDDKRKTIVKDEFF
ncbi:hypothetical protein ROZALSC1DRAFT_31371, partial [Rozella allomycis CSF55]